MSPNKAPRPNRRLASPPQRDVSLRLSRPPRAATLWGDGFAEDGFDVLCAVRSWEHVGEDEYIRVLPRLLPTHGSLPPQLDRHLATCIAVHAWRRHQQGGGPVPALTSIRPETVAAAGRVHHDHWFAEPPRTQGIACAFCSLPCTASTSPPAAQDAVEALDQILGEARRGALRPFDITTAVQFAFNSGIHPAYLWPEALVEQELFFAAGWLGHLQRGRRAIMTADVAAYFDDILMDGDPVVVRSPHLATLLPRNAMAVEVRRAARLRLRGASVIATLRPTPFTRLLAAGRPCLANDVAAARPTAGSLATSAPDAA